VIAQATITAGVELRAGDGDELEGDRPPLHIVAKPVRGGGLLAA
jgi:hypothetical protein